MPTYEYACKQCGEHLDIVQRFTDDALTTCPSCGGSLRKVFGTIGISFKGSGFYKNDSRSGGAKKEKAAATEGGSTPSTNGSETPSTPKADTPAAKTETAKPAKVDKGTSTAAAS